MTQITVNSTHNQTQLFYIYDPMCSWCWGYRPTWIALKKALQAQHPKIVVTHLVGGLAPDSDEAMPTEMQQFLKQTWQKIAQQLGTQFNFDFWDSCQPRRSTYPACRACLLARESGLEEQMIDAIQQAYYLEAKNPSDDSTLISLAVGLGLGEQAFSNALNAPITQHKLLQEIQQTQTLPIQGFPSLVLSVNQQDHVINIDYLDWEKSLASINRILQSS